MSAHLNSILVRWVIVGLMLMPARFVAAQDPLTTARDLYSAAAYDDALTVLNQLSAGNYSPDDSRSIGLYRMLCLMALGRTEEAVRAVEAIVTGDPSYLPSTSNVSPRVRALISDVRRRMLPAIIQEQYLRAKAAWDRREFSAAANGFASVIKGLDDPDLAAMGKQPPLSDLRTLAVGFHELSAKASAPPPTPPTPPPPAAEIAVAPTPAPPAPPSDGIFSTDDANVAMPIILEQSLPPFPAPVLTFTRGEVEIIIDESGSVESATMRISINKIYDQIVLTAAKKWRYQPATLQGVPVKFRKIVTLASR